MLFAPMSRRSRSASYFKSLDTLNLDSKQPIVTMNRITKTAKEPGLESNKLSP